MKTKSCVKILSTGKHVRIKSNKTFNATYIRGALENKFNYFVAYKFHKC